MDAERMEEIVAEDEVAAIPRQAISRLARHLGGMAVLAERCDVSETSVRNWASGRTEPKPTSREKLLEVMEELPRRRRGRVRRADGTYAASGEGPALEARVVDDGTGDGISVPADPSSRGLLDLLRRVRDAGGELKVADLEVVVRIRSR